MSCPLRVQFRGPNRLYGIVLDYVRGCLLACSAVHLITLLLVLELVSQDVQLLIVISALHDGPWVSNPGVSVVYFIHR